MILKYIQHFLSDEGVSYFPGWFDCTKKHMEAFDGFVNVSFNRDKSDQHKIHFFIVFDSTESLGGWAKAPVHLDVLKQLDSYRTKQWVAKYVEF